MRISVIIPAWNAEAHLAEALESVLAQELPADEIIVVNDGATDGTAAIASRYAERGVVLLSRENGGCAAALNTGLAAASGDAYAFLDADDLWRPEKLRLQAAELREQPELEGVFSHVQGFASPDLDAELRARICVPAAPLEGIHKGTLLIQASAFHRIGPFDERVRTGDFVEWYLRAQEKGLRYRVLPQVLYLRRYHAGNHGRLVPQGRQEYVRWLKESLDRRRTCST